MNKKYIEWAILFVLSAMLLLSGVWFYSEYKYKGDVRGKYTFAHTKAKINYLGNIKIVSPESGEMNIYRLDDGGWRFKEAKEYYINEERLSAFFDMVKNSIIVSVQRTDADFMEKNDLNTEKGILVATYDYDGNLLDEIILGKQSPEQGLFWARKANDENYAYVINSITGFSAVAPDWLPYPLLSIKTDEIKWVSINGDKTDYKEFNKLLANSSAWRDLAGILSYLDYYGLDFKSEFIDLPEDTRVRQIDVGMLNGMIYKLTVLDIGNTYWVVISMDAKKIFMIDAMKVAAETYRYYADWVFRLSDEQGEKLFSDNLFY